MMSKDAAYTWGELFGQVSILEETAKFMCKKLEGLFDPDNKPPQDFARRLVAAANTIYDLSIELQKTKPTYHSNS